MGRACGRRGCLLAGRPRRPSTDGVAAVNKEVSTIDHGGGVAGQEHGCGGDLIGLGEAAGWDLLLECLALSVVPAAGPRSRRRNGGARRSFSAPWSRPRSLLATRRTPAPAKRVYQVTKTLAGVRDRRQCGRIRLVAGELVADETLPPHDGVRIRRGVPA